MTTRSSPINNQLFMHSFSHATSTTMSHTFKSKPNIDNPPYPTTIHPIAAPRKSQQSAPIDSDADFSPPHVTRRLRLSCSLASAPSRRGANQWAAGRRKCSVRPAQTRGGGVALDGIDCSAAVTRRVGVAAAVALRRLRSSGTMLHE